MKIYYIPIGSAIYALKIAEELVCRKLSQTPKGCAFHDIHFDRAKGYWFVTFTADNDTDAVTFAGGRYGWSLEKDDIDNGNLLCTFQ